jgi:DNA-binding response OmpR family regulator/anti-sigma regulatory factor (Ser/Thr protein kinase)
MEIHAEPFDLVKVIDEVTTMTKELIEEKPIKYKQELYINENIPITSDRIKVKQILINLLSNSIKYSERGTVKLSIESAEPFYCITVEDDGIGIAPENIEEIFSEFRQVDGTYTRKVGGTGLGLSITKKFIELLGGRIEVKSTIGVGSCFKVYLPIESLNIKRSIEELKYDSNSKMKVVCVDDDPNVQRLYTQYLSDKEFYTIHLNGQEDVTAKIFEILPDVVILDIMLPNKDGWEILTELKNNPITKTIPVIMASVLSEKNLAFRLKADEYLIKPVTQEDLIDTIVRLISKKESLEVLVADDDDNFLNLIGQFLSEESIAYRFARDGVETLEMIEKKNPDLLILDIMMPRKDGFEVIDEIRKNTTCKNMPIIVVTAKDLTADEKEELLARTNMVIQKSGTHIENVMETILKRVKTNYNKSTENQKYF